MRIIGIAAVLVCCNGFGMESAHFRVPCGVFNNGGFTRVTGDEKASDAVGESVEGIISRGYMYKLRSGILSFLFDASGTPLPSPTPGITPTPVVTFTPTPPPNTYLDLTVLLHGCYETADPDSSREASGDYGITIEMRDTNDGAGSNYRYFNVGLDQYGEVAAGPLDLGVIVPGDYYIVVSQLNHLPIISREPLAFDRGETITAHFSDPHSLDFIGIADPDGMYEEADGLFSMHAGNAVVDDGQGKYVNVIDIMAWLPANGSSPGAPNWDIRADFDANGLVNVLDAYKWIHSNGASGDVTIAPLSVEITFPAEDTQTAESKITVTGTVNDNNADVIVNGIDASVAGGTFNAGYVPLPDIGDNIISITAHDAAGNSSQDHITVVRVPW